MNRATYGFLIQGSFCYFAGISLRLVDFYGSLIQGEFLTCAANQGDFVHIGFLFLFFFYLIFVWIRKYKKGEFVGILFHAVLHVVD